VFEARLSQLESPQARSAGRVVHSLVRFPGRIRQRRRHARLEQHQIGTAGIDKQTYLLTSDGHSSGQKRPRELQSDRFLLAFRRETQHAPPIIDAKAHPRQYVQSDNRIDTNASQV
jgi:hypothetical protein